MYGNILTVWSSEWLNKYKLNVDAPKLKPVSEYLKLEGRFPHLSDDITSEIQQWANEEYGNLKEKVGGNPQVDLPASDKLYFPLLEV